MFIPYALSVCNCVNSIHNTLGTCKHMLMLYTVARTSETVFGVCYDACFSQINLAFGKYFTDYM